MPVDLRTLTVFVKVGERRSFVRAAAELGMGQSGVSNAINRLEDELGVQLLARTTRSVNLTDDGAAFLLRSSEPARRAHINDIGIAWVDHDPADTARLRKSHIGPGLACIGSLVDTVPHHVAIANRPGFSGACPYDIVVSG